jgi:hypothetical protein
MSLENLKLQLNYFQRCKKMQDYSIKTAVDKIELVKKLNTILEKQLTNFDNDRQNECMLIYKQLYDLDNLCNTSEDYIKTIKEINNLDEKMRTLCVKIDQLEATIPNEKIVTNFKVTPKEDSLEKLEKLDSLI